jgi:hypothetical protein
MDSARLSADCGFRAAAPQLEGVRRALRAHCAAAHRSLSSADVAARRGPAVLGLAAVGVDVGTAVVDAGEAAGGDDEKLVPGCDGLVKQTWLEQTTTCATTKSVAVPVADDGARVSRGLLIVVRKWRIWSRVAGRLMWVAWRTEIR